ncbi:MAG TPA: ABC transporter ATP-binding protein [Bryobacteraceae bacterium]|nr:ABC transporter ATP-binding protein [Bryobacteraceae bacterium]
MLKAESVTKRYETAAGPVEVLQSANLTLEQGQAAAIMGPSGSGKSTLLYLLGALDTPTSGTITLQGSNVGALGDNEAAAFRNRHIGFVFQDHALLPQCTVLENVLVPTLVAPAGPYGTRARALLERVGLSHRLDHFPAQLSGGEKQRAAIARALIREPQVLLCDEPTGNLDRNSANTVADLLLELHAAQQTILVVVTHSGELASRMPQRYELIDRRLERV